MKIKYLYKKMLLAIILQSFCSCGGSHNDTNVAIYESEYRVHYDFIKEQSELNKRVYVISKIETLKHCQSIVREDSWMLFASNNEEPIKFYFDYWTLYGMLENINIGDEVFVTKDSSGILYIEFSKLRNIYFRRK